jgi:hypothetical protein
MAKTVLGIRTILIRGVLMRRIAWLSALIACLGVLCIGYVSGST